MSATNRSDGDEVHTAEQKISEALGLLGKIDDIRKIAGTLRHNAGKVEEHSDAVRTALARVLTQAQSALSDASAETTGDAA